MCGSLLKIFISKGDFMWILQNGTHDVIKVSSLFNNKGLNQLQNDIDDFEHKINNPTQFSWKDIKHFYKIPYNQLAWNASSSFVIN